jgi:hypothetical protein
MNTIPYADLLQDLVYGEVKPAYNDKRQVVYVPTGKAGTFDILKAQVLPVHDALARGDEAEAVSHAFNVAQSMRAFRGRAATPNAKAFFCQAVTSVAQRGGTFVDAVEAVASAGKAEFGRQLSAASKMLQLYPAFCHESVVYDNFVRKAVSNLRQIPARKTKNMADYWTQVSGLASEPLVSMPDGSRISMGQFLSLPEVKMPAWASSESLTGFVKRRALDRALWLVFATPREAE